jgi:hypothetical protein
MLIDNFEVSVCFYDMYAQGNSLRFELPPSLEAIDRYQQVEKITGNLTYKPDDLPGIIA